MKFPKLGISTTHKNILLGGVASAAVDTVIDHALSRAGALYSVTIRDDAGRYVWGVGTGDVANLAIGAGLLYYGKKKNKPKFKELGFGWVLAQVTTKIAELGGYVQTLDPVYPTEYVIGGPTVRLGPRVNQTPATFRQNSIPMGQSKYRLTS